MDPYPYDNSLDPYDDLDRKVEELEADLTEDQKETINLFLGKNYECAYDMLQAERKINRELRQVLDRVAAALNIKTVKVEFTDVTFTPNMDDCNE